MEEKKLEHIAFIMDGNGRWAKARGQVREYGHKFGMQALERVLSACRARGIGTVTVYAFSTENWKRPRREVETIVRLLGTYVDKSMKELEENRLRYRFIGDLSVFSEKLRSKMELLEVRSAGYTDMLNIAVNYGGRAELAHAFEKLAAAGKTHITEEDISDALYTSGSPDPDLMVRTGGEYRLSNFLTWQTVYSELYFTDVFWPDFDEEELDRAIQSYKGRSRRFGGLNPEVQTKKGDASENRR